MRSFAYFIREAVKGFRRNASTAFGSIITTFLSLFVIGLFLVGGIIVNNVMQSVENEVSITAYVSDDADQTDIDAVQDYISGLDYVSSVTFTTKEQALENFTSSSSTNAEYIAQLDGENPLPASIDIELTDPQQVSSVADQIANYTGFQEICDTPDDPSADIMYGQQTVERIFSLVNYVRYIGAALIVLLIFIALVFISNTIRLAILARRKEIAIMRLVGASNGFIRGPFLTEGAMHAIIGSALAVVCLELLRRFVLPRVREGMAFLPLDIGAQQFVVIYVGLVVAGFVIGIIGSAFAMRRYLKV